jgi:hypothetical protein
MIANVIMRTGAQELIGFVWDVGAVWDGLHILG